MKRVLTGVAAALAATGCGTERPAEPHARQPAPAAAVRSAPAPDHGRPVIVFRRIRYMGATMRILTVHPDGTIRIDIPNGGAGGSFFAGRVRPRVLAGIVRAVRRTPWTHLSHRKVRYAASDPDAYFMLRHRGVEHLAFARGMSPDLLPLVRRLNGVVEGRGRTRYEPVHRYYTP